MRLFEPGMIGAMQVKNRVVMAALGMGRIADEDGNWGEKVREYYVARARGGTGLITTSLVFVSQKLESFTRHHLDLYSDVHLDSLARMVEAVHRHDAKVAVQLTAGFGRVLSARWQDKDVSPVSASATPCHWNPERKTRALTTEEARDLASAFGAAAKRCQMAGIDAVELHGHEGYILDQFMTGLWNRRTDRYGGSREKRLTFARESIAAIREAVGEAFPVIYRFGIDHYLEGGRTPDESVWIAQELEKMGVDALHVDAGCYETWWWAHPPTYQPRGCMVDMAEKVKPAVKVPVIAVGKLNYPALAEQVLVDGKADFIAIGRGLLADPDWANKVREGRFQDIAPCIGDHDGCSGELRQNRATSCTVNPSCGHEKEWALTPTGKKAVLVIGGGPAGMEAARVAAARGLEVTLWEKTERLGGSLWPASVPDFKRDLRDLIEYQAHQLRKMPVSIELSRQATPEAVLGFGAQTVILATGAVQEKPGVPGASADTAMTAVDVLSNRARVRGSVLVVGGGLIGCETAVYLARKGHRVTLTSRRSELLTGMIDQNRFMLLKMMSEADVAVLTNTWPVQVVPGGLIAKQDSQERRLTADSVVFAGGMRSCNELHQALQGSVAELYAVGDCVDPRRIMDAIWEGFHVARQIEA